MKKIIFVLTLILLILPTAGCFGAPAAKEETPPDNLPPNYIAIENWNLFLPCPDNPTGNWSPSSFREKDIPQKHTLTFDGVLYTGTYEFSLRDIHEKQAKRVYRCSNDTFFYLNVTDGKLVYFYTSTPYGSTHDIGISACIEKARSYLNTQVDAADYQPLCKWDEDAQAYHIVFQKYWNHIATLDRAVFYVWPNGSIKEYSAIALGTFQTNAPLSFDIQEAKRVATQALENKLGTAGTNGLEFGEPDIRIFNLMGEAGTPVLLVSFEITRTSGEICHNPWTQSFYIINDAEHRFDKPVFTHSSQIQVKEGMHLYELNIMLGSTDRILFDGDHTASGQPLDEYYWTLDLEQRMQLCVYCVRTEDGSRIVYRYEWILP